MPCHECASPRDEVEYSPDGKRMHTWYAVRHQQLYNLRASITCLMIQVFALEFLRAGWTNFIFKSERDVGPAGPEDIFLLLVHVYIVSFYAEKPVWIAVTSFYAIMLLIYNGTTPEGNYSYGVDDYNESSYELGWEASWTAKLNMCLLVFQVSMFLYKLGRLFKDINVTNPYQPSDEKAKANSRIGQPSLDTRGPSVWKTRALLLSTICISLVYGRFVLHFIGVYLQASRLQMKLNPLPYTCFVVPTQIWCGIWLGTWAQRRFLENPEEKKERQRIKDMEQTAYREWKREWYRKMEVETTGSEKKVDHEKGIEALIEV